MDEGRGAALETLADRLGHRFSRWELLEEALTHPSVSAKNRSGGANYERLEFLGDRVLGLIVAEMLWRRFPRETEGPLTRRHAHLVRRDTLADVGRGLDLGGHILLQAGEEGEAMRASAGLNADACEAVIAALYLDGGIEAARSFVEHHWERRIEAATRPPRDPKTTLQEWAQGRGLPLPAYRIVSTEGPDHRRIFTVEVMIEGMPPAIGRGSSKRNAEVEGATRMLDAIAVEGGK